MVRTIGMLELRKRPGEFLDETFYRKSRFLIKRNRKAKAVLVPIEDFARYFEDEDIASSYRRFHRARLYYLNLDATLERQSRRKEKRNHRHEKQYEGAI